ncbi:glycoside hydrolase family 5 protein [Tenggerimyces flavus]|uniref:Glycoside hydrolase family 5 protein n=1 Tax=Tenggerimyces flavus TaxID=1708749 RepID=A0ABV7YKD1_9ACTN|nr:glycoside hydrolase family 5 protein [Tenggerimyces flavus]MBM7789557.1 hypothetical protein [Tenggerimyces flavus]
MRLNPWRPDRRQLLSTAGIVTGAAMLSLRPGLAKAGTHPTGFYAGANVSGLEVNQGKIPGVPNTDFAVPTAAEFDNLRGNGLVVLRIPFIWERMQSTLLGALSADYLGILTGLADYAADHGQSLILDMHNYGGRGPNKLGNGNLTPAHFANVWSRLATAFVGHPGIAAYDLMNEPSNMPNASAWPTAAQAAINAIRQVDPATTIYAEGDNWSSAASWVAVNGNLDLNDPANNLVYSAHTYFDRDSSGTHYSWTEEVAAGDQLKNPPGPLTTQIGVQRFTGFVNWLQDKGFRGQVGECGTGKDDPNWLATLDNTLAFCQQNGVGLTYWAAGLWFTEYPMGIEPGRDGRDTVQMAVLQKYTGAEPSKNYLVTGPDRGAAGSQSAPFTADYRGYHAAALQLTPTSSAGTFQPTSLTIPAGFNGAAAFRFTAPSLATYAIATANTSGLTNPPPIGYSTRTDAYSVIDPAAIMTALSTHRLYTPYVGDAVTLYRASDGAQRGFPFLANDSLDTAAISSWAGGSNVFVVRLSDQSPRGRHAGTVTSQNQNGPGGTQLPSHVDDYPQLVLNGPGGLPVLRFATSRMDAVAPINGLTGFTCVMVCKPSSVASMQRLLSWHFTEFLLLAGDGSGTWQQSGESSLSLGIDPTAWHIYTARWAGGGQRTTWVDGEVVGSAAAATPKITFNHDNRVNLGYFRWFQNVYFTGDVLALLPFGAALSDAQLNQLWSTLSDLTGIGA